MKEIPLTQGRVALVDDADFEAVSKHKWSYSDGYAAARIGGRRVSMHRWLMGEPRRKEVDHVDGNRANNQRHNLRVCTRLQNLMNRPKPNRYTTSKYKGVSWIAKQGYWQARIQGGTAPGIFIIGQYATELEAAAAYNAAAIQYHGEYARLNVIEAP
jgi:hypothetical protein